MSKFSLWHKITKRFNKLSKNFDNFMDNNFWGPAEELENHANKIIQDQAPNAVKATKKFINTSTQAVKELGKDLGVGPKPSLLEKCLDGVKNFINLIKESFIKSSAYIKEYLVENKNFKADYSQFLPLRSDGNIANNIFSTGDKAIKWVKDYISSLTTGKNDRDKGKW